MEGITDLSLLPRPEPASSLLSYNTRNRHFQAAPFFRGYYDSFLPDAEYEALAEAFPGPDCFIRREGKYGKTVFKSGSAFTEFIGANPRWQQLFDLFASPRFINELRFALGDGIAKARPEIANKNWSQVRSPSEADNDDFPIKMSIEFSRLHRGDYLEPHTDNPNKIVSLLYYFQDPDWELRYGGGTDFYAPKFDRLNDNWENRYMNFGAMRRIWSPEFVANRLAFFVKDKNSWHGISQLTCPENVPRKALLINYETFSDKVHAVSLKSKMRFFDLRALYRLKEAVSGKLSTPFQDTR